MRVNMRYKVYPMVGTRSRAIRGSTSDDRVGCSASEGRYAPARPALHVSPRLSPFLPCALASAMVFGLFIIAPSVNVLGRNRRKPSTLRGAAPDVVIGQSTAARAGARPYHSGGKRFARLSYVDVHGLRPEGHQACILPRNDAPSPAPR